MTQVRQIERHLQPAGLILIRLLFALLLTDSSANAGLLDTVRDCGVRPELDELRVGRFMMGAPLVKAQQGIQFDFGFWGVWKKRKTFIKKG